MGKKQHFGQEPPAKIRLPTRWRRALLAAGLLAVTTLAAPAWHAGAADDSAAPAAAGGPTAYVVNNGANNVSVIDTASNEITATVEVGNFPRKVAISGKRAYVTNLFADNVSVIDTESNKVTATVPVGKGPVGVAVEPRPSPGRTSTTRQRLGDDTTRSTPRPARPSPPCPWASTRWAWWSRRTASGRT
ncbi:YncE family protein [Carbonactinospora thermoautotrophica]|uniref:YncE family protein n=1 Tax=Carbonactinospora thermoautotrophica TaxID=1469144 RepID=UPI0008309A57|nr:YncE family protein [Carbonactinospora thermoautotrophica]